MATNVLKAHKLTSAESLGASFTSDPVTIVTLDYVSFNIATSGVTTNTGTFYVQHRMYSDANNFSSWATLTLSSVPTLNNANDTFLIDLKVSPGQVRVGYTAPGGSPDGTVDIWVSGAAIGGRS